MGFLWLLQWLPLSVLAALGRGLGSLLWRVASSRRRIALRNLELCFPDLPLEDRRKLAKEHFQWLGRSILERSLLWFASAERLKKVIHVEGDVKLAERSQKPVMWLVPHFMGLDVAGVAVLLFQEHEGLLDVPGAEQQGDGRRDPPRPPAFRACRRSSRAATRRCR